MGATTQNRGLANSAAEAQMRSRQTGKASMFPREAPGGSTPLPPGLEESSFRRGEITRERDRTGRREEIFRDLQSGTGQTAEVTPGGAVERGATVCGAPFGGTGQGPARGLRSGIAFGPGRSTRMPEPGSPEYQQLIQRARGLR